MPANLSRCSTRESMRGDRVRARCIIYFARGNSSDGVCFAAGKCVILQLQIIVTCGFFSRSPRHLVDAPAKLSFGVSLFFFAFARCYRSLGNFYITKFDFVII